MNTGSSVRQPAASSPMRVDATPRRRVPGWAYPIASLVGIVLLWELWVQLGRPPAYLVPAPSAVAQELVARWELLRDHTVVTLGAAVAGFLISILIGIPLATLIVASRPLERSIYPILVTSQAVPKVAIAPLILVWLGFGLTPKIVIAVLMAFFPIVIDTVAGLKGVPTQMIFLGRSMGLSPSRMFWRIRLPYALPHIFSGLKVAITLSVVGVVVGEFVGSASGLGYLILLASGRVQTLVMYSALVWLVVIGIVLFAAVQLAERLFLPWHVSVRRDNE